MPISAPFHGLSTKLYVSTSAVDKASLSAGDLLGEVQEIGALELTANVIEYNSYGQSFKRKLVGQRDSGVLDINLNWVPDATSQAVQDRLKSYYESGAKLYFGLLWEDPTGE